MSRVRLDVGSLYHNAATWPLAGKLLSGCALAGLVLLVGDRLYLDASQDRLRQAELNGVALEQQLAQKSVLAAGLEQRTQQLQVLREQVEARWRQLPGESAMPGLLDDTARLALANGLLVESITPLDEQARPFYIEQPVQIGVSGTFHDLARFVSALGGLSRITTVHDLALRPDGKLLRLDLLARTYWHAQQSGGAGEYVAQASSFVYDPQGLRDPFQPLAVQVTRTRGRPAQAPDLARPRGILEALAVDQFEMVGTLSRGMQAFVLLRAASEVHRLAVGDYLGPHHGRITAIYAGHIELVELFPDEQGDWLERPRTLALNVNS
jgi:type IV pilus assembly protein PilOP